MQTPKAPRISNPSIVEIGFHPTLCRGLDADEQPGDEGVYLVLQTKNSDGEFVQGKGKLTVVVVDPQRMQQSSTPDQARIARWEWTSEQIRELTEPIGVSQGIHLSLSLASNKPISDTVQVHVRYEQEDGRKLINQKEVRLHNPQIAAGTWTARVPSEQPQSNTR